MIEIHTCMKASQFTVCVYNWDERSEPHIDDTSAIFSICIYVLLWYDGLLFLNVCGAARYL